jgi:hypothetical protein
LSNTRGTNGTSTFKMYSRVRQDPINLITAARKLD